MTRKRILLTYFCFLLLLLAGTVVVLQESGVAHTFVENLLTRVLGKDRFRLGNARLDVGGGSITLEQLEISSEGSADANQAILAIDTLEVGVGTNPLDEVGKVSLAASGLHFTMDLSGGRVPDFAGLIRSAGLEGNTGEDSETPPEITITDSRITLLFDPDAPAVEFDQVELQLTPEEESGTDVLLSGSMRAPGGQTVTVSGSGNVESGSLRALLEMSGVPLSPETLGPFGSYVSEYLERSGVSGAADKVSVWVEYPSTDSAGVAVDQLVAGVNLELNDIDCRLPELPYPLIGANARISSTTRDDGTVRFTLRNASVHGSLHARGTITEVFGDDPQIDLRLEANDVLVGTVLEETLRNVPAAARVWDAVQPHGGRAAVDLRVWSDGEGDFDASMDLDLYGVHAIYRGFPQSDGNRIGFPHRIEDISGRVSVRPGLVRLDGLEGRLGAEGRIRIGGDISDIQPGPIQPRFDLRITGDDVELDAEFREHLAAIGMGIQDVYDEFDPRGRANMEIAVHSIQVGDIPDVTLRVSPLGASVRYRDFPLRVEGLHGSILADNHGTDIRLAGERGDARLRIDGRLRPWAEGGVEAELWLNIEDLELDRELADAMASLGPGSSRIWEAIEPSGRVDCEVALWRESGSEDPNYDVRLDLDGVRAEPDLLQAPVVDLRGPVFVHGTGTDHRIDISAVRGELDRGEDSKNAQALLQGSVVGIDDQVHYDLTGILRELDLDTRLADTLDRLGVLERASWDAIAPSGTVDVVALLSGEGERATPSLRVLLKGIRSDAEVLPYPLTDVSGEVLVAAGEAVLQNVTAKLADAEVNVREGSVRGDPSSGILIQGEIAAQRLPLDDRFARMLSGPLRDNFLARQIRGRFDADPFRMKLLVPPEGQGELRSEFSGNLIARDIDLSLGTRLRSITGRVRLQDAVLSEDDGRMRATLEGGAVTVLGHRFTGVNADWLVDPAALRLDNVTGRVHSGRIFGADDTGPDLLFSFLGETDLSCRVRWEQVSLAQLLRTAGFEGADKFRGNLRGVATVDSMPGTRLLDMVARGSLAISEGRLGQVPIFTRIYAILSPRKRPQFEGGELDFRIEDEVVNIESLSLRSPLVEVNGQGSVRMDGYIDMALDFPNFFQSAPSWLRPDIVLKNLVEFEIFGYLRDPQARPRWFFKERADEVPIGPVPAFRPDR